MSNTPSKAEIEALVKRHGATSYRNRADTQHPAYGFTEDGLNGLIDEVLAKWGTPQPVVREPLTDEQLAEMMRDTWGCASIAPRHALEFARAVERAHGIDEVIRLQTQVKQDEALIRQMHDALCECAEDSQEQLDRMEAAKLRQYKPQAVAYQESTIDAAKRAITAARARLGEKT